MVAESFACYLVSKDEAGTTRGEVTRRSAVQLPAGEVLIQVEWSALNYKDALSASGNPAVTRVFPHVPGIDAAGIVVESSSPMVDVGDNVFVTGYDLGQNTWGGFGELVRVPASWVMPLPDGLSLRESMIYGTAGLTAAQSIEALQRNEVFPDSGEVIVTGASGGVGSLAVALLAKLGYHVVAVSGKPQAHERLKTLGARRVVGREEVSDTTRKPMLSPRWAGAIDTVGGNTLATLVRSLEHDGCVAACGLVGGFDLPLTVYPFILRGASIIGIDSVQCPLESRTRIWRKLAHGWKPPKLDMVVSEEVRLKGLAGAIERILAGKTLGRVLVQPKADA